MPKFIINLDNNDHELIKKDNIVCYLMDSALEKTQQKKAADFASQNDAMILAAGENAVALCKDLNLDGITTSKFRKKEINEIKAEIGKSKAIGILCPANRHAAMLASEAEPEFMIFEANDSPEFQEFITWYNELFLIQSAIIIDQNFKNFASLDTDFAILKPKDFKILVAK